MSVCPQIVLIFSRPPPPDSLTFDKCGFFHTQTNNDFDIMTERVHINYRLCKCLILKDAKMVFFNPNMTLTKMSCLQEKIINLFSNRETFDYAKSFGWPSGSMKTSAKVTDKRIVPNKCRFAFGYF